MGKKNKSGNNLGRALIKDRFGSSHSRRNKDSSLLHTADVDDGYDWGRLNLQSVTEESSFQEFLSTAELAGTEFQAEKLNITFVNPKSGIGLLSGQEIELVKQTQDQNRDLLGIPRRPKWDSNTTAEELQTAEREAFLEWRRRLAQLQEVKGLLLTPYEKNIEFWKQLWRVVERSDIVVQIVDSRNPLLFRCEDLEKYVTEVSSHKCNLILLNKADFLTPEQRKTWAEYFNSINVKIAFFSATLAAEEVENEEGGHGKEGGEEEEDITDNCLLSRDALIKLFRTLHSSQKVIPGVTTVGLVGYPNVGKSSTINALLTYKKVSVSATPGKTKHFQTLYLDKDLMLCDCPGLVMPSFVFTKAEMVVNGILPIDQMRDHVPPVTLLATLIPRQELEHTYGIMLPLPQEGEDPMRPPTADEFLNAYGYNRGFMTQNGQPDNSRSARYILKDFVKGKLLYCYAPPGHQQVEYHVFPERSVPHSNNVIRKTKAPAEDLDVQFFQKVSTGVHVKGAQNARPADGKAKPWKDHREKRNKREKLRRVYAYLDE